MIDQDKDVPVVTPTPAADPSPAPEDTTKDVPYSRFKEVNDKKKAYEAKFGPLDDNGNPLPKAADPTDPIAADVKSLKEKQDRRDFQDENNLTKAEVDWLWKTAGGKPSADMLEDPGVKAALKAIRSDKRVDDNTPSGGRAVPTYQGKTWDQIANDPSISDADKQKAFETLTPSQRRR